MNRKRHWQSVYERKETARLGWYKPHLERSLEWIEVLGLVKDAPIIDVGGGASTLVDDLLERGFTSLTVLDISDHALRHARGRLGKRADDVEWLCGDVTDVELPENHFALWHDRAVFHFLTDADDRRLYLKRVRKALRLGGHVIIGTFAPDAPPKCSGLPVQRYTRESLTEEFGDAFELVADTRELHVTPGGVEQMYLYCRFRKTG